MVYSLYCFNMFSILPYVVVFLLSLHHPADTDIGWHLKYGEFFFQNGRIALQNTFSSQMPDYHWINHSWLSDVLSYAIFQFGGFLGLSIAGALIITLTFYFISKAAKLSFWKQAVIFPLLYYLEEPLLIISFRSQLLSILGIALIYYLYKKYEEGNAKSLLFLPPLFMLWANLHGGFILGLGLLIFFITCKIVQNIFTKTAENITAQNLRLAITASAAVLATLVNPYGLKIYQETFKHLDNPLQKYIVEWTPFELFSQLWWNVVVWGAVLLISFVIVFRKRIHYKFIPLAVAVAVLYLFSFWMRRYNWPMYLLSVPIVATVVEALKPQKKEMQKFIPVIIFAGLYLYIAFIKLPILNIFRMNWVRYCVEFVSCSQESAQYILDHKLFDNLYTFYNWGGWIIWQYPQIKPSIDGRMAFWTDGSVYSAFKDYFWLEQNLTDMDISQWDVVWIPPSKPIHEQMENLVSQGKWTRIFRDNFALIYIRNTKLDSVMYGPKV